MTTTDIALSSAVGNGQPLTMSTLEIAELTDKEHRNVMRDTRKMLVELHGEGGVLTFEHTHRNPQNGQDYPVYRLPKRESLILVSGYSVDLRARIIDRWLELESGAGSTEAALRALNDPAAMRGLLLVYTEKVLTLESHVADLLPKADALGRIAESEGSFCITDAAKTLQVQPKALFSFLRSHRWIYTRAGSSQEVAYQDKLASGLLEHKTTTVSRSDGSEKTVTQVRVTPKGLARLAQEFPPVAKVA